MTLVAVSRAPLDKLEAFRRRMGWGFKWVYSCYARGLDTLNGAYHYLDLVPKGRDEDGLSYSMAWVRHHDRYGD